MKYKVGGGRMVLEKRVYLNLFPIFIKITSFKLRKSEGIYHIFFPVRGKILNRKLNSHSPQFIFLFKSLPLMLLFGGKMIKIIMEHCIMHSPTFRSTRTFSDFSNWNTTLFHINRGQRPLLNLVFKLLPALPFYSKPNI